MLQEAITFYLAARQVTLISASLIHDVALHFSIDRQRATRCINAYLVELNRVTQ